MLEFDPESSDLKVERVLIKSITPYGLEIPGEARRRKIHRKLYTWYTNTYHTKWFRKPQKAAVLTYHGQLLAIEMAPLANLGSIKDSTFENMGLDKDAIQDRWEPNLQKSLDALLSGKHLKHLHYRFFVDIDGIYQVRKNLAQLGPLDEQGVFRIGRVKSYRFVNMVLAGFINEKGLGMVTWKDVMAMDLGGSRKVVGPTLPENTVAEKLAKLAKFETLKMARDEGTFKSWACANYIETLELRYRVNAEFLYHAAKTIRKHYGYKALAPFRLDKVLRSIGVSSIGNMSRSTRMGITTGLPLRDMVALIFGYIYKENDFHKLLDLHRILRVLWTSGLVDVGEEGSTKRRVDEFNREDSPLVDANVFLAELGQSPLLEFKVQ